MAFTIRLGWQFNTRQWLSKPLLTHTTPGTKCFAPHDLQWSLYSLPLDSRRAQASSSREAKHAENRLALMRSPRFFPHLHSKCYLGFFFLPWHEKPLLNHNTGIPVTFFSPNFFVFRFIQESKARQLHFPANLASGQSLPGISFVGSHARFLPTTFIRWYWYSCFFQLQRTLPPFTCNSVYHSVTPYSDHAFHSKTLVDDCTFVNRIPCLNLSQNVVPSKALILTTFAWPTFPILTSPTSRPKVA